MSFLMRGRSAWWRSDQIHPREAQRSTETVTAATGLPVAALAPEGGTDDLRASNVSDPWADCGIFQVVMSDVMKPGFEAWLKARGLYLAPTPVQDDLPTFHIGIKNLHGGTR